MSYKTCLFCHRKFEFERATKKYCGKLCKTSYWNSKSMRIAAKLTSAQKKKVEALVSEFKEENKHQDVAC